jgi:peptidoglycan/xylan/chitin deacetylase (PgdA/CDA1 family)
MPVRFPFPLKQIAANKLPALAICPNRATDRRRVGPQRFCLTLSPSGIPQFALPRSLSFEQNGYAKLSGKLSRCLARNVATKKLPLTNVRPLVTFTFDDAPTSACTTGALMLERHKARGTFYISGAGCGTAGYCGHLVTAEQVRMLCQSGHEIGCHTFSHAAVARVSHAALVADLARNRSFLQSIHRDLIVRNFAYPYGELSFRTKLYLQARFDSCRSLQSGVNVGSADLGALKCCELEDASIDRQGVAAIIGETARRRGWLIFVCHDVDEKPSRYGVSPALLDFALQRAHAAGCHLVTVADALAVLKGAVVYPGEDDCG